MRNASAWVLFPSFLIPRSRENLGTSISNKLPTRLSCILMSENHFLNQLRTALLTGRLVSEMPVNTLDWLLYIEQSPLKFILFFFFFKAYSSCQVAETNILCTQMRANIWFYWILCCVHPATILSFSSSFLFRASVSFDASGTSRRSHQNILRDTKFQIGPLGDTVVTEAYSLGFFSIGVLEISVHYLPEPLAAAGSLRAICESHRAPHAGDVYAPEVTKAYITSRLESVHIILR